jgi:predicted small lipoprotein YifL
MSDRQRSPIVSDRPFLRLALIGALVASLALAACGRKGPLDPPPGASDNSSAPPAQSSGMTSPIGVSPLGGAPLGAQSSSSNLTIGPNGEPLAPKGPKKFIPLDVLLN